MNTTTATDTRDRYQRLTENIEILADDQNLAAAEPPFDIEGLRHFVGSIVEERLLDGLTDLDADTVGLLSGVDFFQGPPRLVWRIYSLLNAERSYTRENADDAVGVIRALVGILHMMLGAWTVVAADEEAVETDGLSDPEWTIA
jgi:hypothetical protein